MEPWLVEARNVLLPRRGRGRCLTRGVVSSRRWYCRRCRCGRRNGNQKSACVATLEGDGWARREQVGGGGGGVGNCLSAVGT